MKPSIVSAIIFAVSLTSPPRAEGRDPLSEAQETARQYLEMTQDIGKPSPTLPYSYSRPTVSPTTGQTRTFNYKESPPSHSQFTGPTPSAPVAPTSPPFPGGSTPVTPLRPTAETSSPINFIVQGNRLPKYPDRTEEEVIEASANLLINQYSDYNEICKVRMLGMANGMLPLASFIGGTSKTSIPYNKCVNPRLFYLLQANPYRCSTEEPYGNVRLDWLIAQLADQDTYHQVAQIPKTEEEIRTKYGIDISYKNHTIIRKVLDGSIVSRDTRVVGIVPDHTSALRALVTYDFNLEVTKALPRNPYVNLVPSFDAGEYFFIKPNGLWDYMLHDIQGNKRINSAPAGVADFHAGIEGLAVSQESPAVKEHARYASIRNHTDCTICHASGVQSFGYGSANKEVVRSLANFGHFAEIGSEARARALYNVPTGKETDSKYDDAADFNKKLAQIGNLFTAAQESMGISKPDPNNPKLKTIHPFLADTATLYLAPLSFADVASELGVSGAQLKKAFQANPNLFRLLGLNPSSNLDTVKIDRQVMEQRNCFLKAEMRGETYNEKDRVQTYTLVGYKNTSRNVELHPFEVLNARRAGSFSKDGETYNFPFEQRPLAR